MQVRVLFFGILKDVLGRDADALSLSEGATVRDLVAHFAAQSPRLQDHLRSIAVSVNQEFATATAPLHDGDEVGLLPPVSGGSGAVTDAAEPYVRIVRDRIIPHDIIPPLERPDDGAVVIFDGIVRNHSRGRRTLYLEYESYEQMALKLLRDLAGQAISKFDVRTAAVVHRLGRIEIGESSVLIAVFSAHRAAAFDACRFLIDTLKKTVPIWKKEFFEDGAVWADGEPFPPEIATSERNRSSSE
ncbi:MAG: molybdenum cofactor biosynthesis protein [Terriglobales bacterium]